MSREPDVMELIAQLAPCPYCHAPSRIPCASESGRRRTYSHGTRFYLAGDVINAVINWSYQQTTKALDNAAATTK